MYNDQQDKIGTGSKELKAKYDYSYVWMSWVLKKFENVSLIYILLSI